MQMSFRLILNADDFGLTKGINRAIERLHQARALSSATLMATGPAFADAVAVSRRNPALGVGCHLVFVDGVPVSHPESIPTLVGGDGKRFRHSYLDFVQALLRGQIDPEDVGREAQAQIQLLQRAGLDVTHIDSHKHTHLFPAVARVVLHIAQRCGVAAFRYPFEPRWIRPVSGVRCPQERRWQQSALDLFEPSFRRLTDSSRDQRTTSGTIGIAATGTLDSSVLSLTLASILSNGADRTYEFCCHPGFHDADLARQNTRLLRVREVEYEALLKTVPEFLQNPGAPELIHYGDLGVPGLQRASRQFTPFTGYEKVL